MGTLLVNGKEIGRNYFLNIIDIDSLLSWVEWDYRRSLLQFLLVPQTVLGSRETLKQIITRAGCWICLNIALNVGFTFWKYKHISQ